MAGTITKQGIRTLSVILQCDAEGNVASVRHDYAVFTDESELVFRHSVLYEPTEGQKTALNSLLKAMVKQAKQNEGIGG